MTLLVHFYNRMCLEQAPVIMDSPVRDKAVPDIHSTAGEDLGFEKGGGADGSGASFGTYLGQFRGLFKAFGAKTGGRAPPALPLDMELKVARKGQFSRGAIGDIVEVKNRKEWVIFPKVVYPASDE